MNKKKVLYITPHLSTGGLPEYLWKKIQLLNDRYDIYVIEYNNLSGNAFLVQKNQIIDFLTRDKVFTLSSNKNEIFNYINKINPSIIHMEEFPELFMDDDIAHKLYNTDYHIIETSHTSIFNSSQKRYLPDKFIFPSPYQLKLHKTLDVPKSLAEFPIEFMERPNRTETLQEIGLDPDYKHIVMVGLFTEGKNQKEIFDIAHSFKQYKVQFHFVGNQAGNFKNYWKPLMDSKSDNCIIHGERLDVDKFYSACDLFYFSSTYELCPLVIKEGIGWGIPIMMYNLHTYCGMYDKVDGLHFIDNLHQVDKVNMIKEILNIKSDLTTDYTIPNPKITNNKNLKFSIITPCYNVEKYLDETAKSVLSQTYQNWEWVLTDDWSSDNTKQKIEELLKKDSRIVYKQQEHKMEMWNNPQRFADGDIIVTLDSDDCLLPKTLEVYNRMYNKFSDVTCIHSDCNWYNKTFDKGNFSKSSLVNYKDSNSMLDMMRNVIEKNNYLEGVYNCFGHARSFRNIDGMEFLNVRGSNDAIQVLTTEEMGRHLFLNRTMYNYRLGDQSLSRGKSYNMVRNWKQIISDFDERRKDVTLNNPTHIQYYDIVREHLYPFLFSPLNDDNDGKNISCINFNLDDSKYLISDVYFDHNIMFDVIDESVDYYFVILSENKDFDIYNRQLEKSNVLYYLNKSFTKDVNGLFEYIKSNINIPYSFYRLGDYHIGIQAGGK
tara:strand:- start:1134 stop:3275 length:2142 start_codon:yes stop_codon:yes gene_type:complete